MTLVQRFEALEVTMPEPRKKRLMGGILTRSSPGTPTARPPMIDPFVTFLYISSVLAPANTIDQYMSKRCWVDRPGAISRKSMTSCEPLGLRIVMKPPPPMPE